MLLLGIDIGGSKVALALGDEQGRVRAHMRRPTESSGRPDEDLARIAEDARRLLAKAGARASDLAQVGLSVPGPIDRERGLLLRPPNLPGWEQVPVCASLGAALGVPAHLENDANAAALAEWRYGPAAASSRSST